MLGLNKFLLLPSKQWIRGIWDIFVYGIVALRFLLKILPVGTCGFLFLFIQVQG